MASPSMPAPAGSNLSGWASDYPANNAGASTSAPAGVPVQPAGSASGIAGYNSSNDARAASAMGIPVINQPHTTGFSSSALTSLAADSFVGSYGHPERDPNAIRSYQGSDGMGAPSDLSRSYLDPRQSQGQTASVSDTGVSRVTYGNQAPAPKTF